MKNSRNNLEKGFSLLEILVGMTVVSIVTAIAISTFGRSRETFGRDTIVQQFKGNLEAARNDSIRRRAQNGSEMASVVLISAQTYKLQADFNYNGQLENFETRTITIQSDNSAVLPNNVDYPVTIRFDWRGMSETFDNNGNAVSPQFTFCSKCKNSNGSFQVTSDNADVVGISETGGIEIRRGGNSASSAATPNITDVPANQNVRDQAKINSNSNANTGGNPTPTVTPTPTATPTPTPQPTATPTPQPTATPTPNPTPTPKICVKNERPEETGCICQSPMTVGSNGQCK